ncbi:LacI family transcriptional regulator [Lactonifactor longoviformis]|uniref:GntR family transcriptional regulator, arabinose operon transcriptional repressor n=1 Tax=Lactonifactor longoviformis DSM 17459 TaxID=1122155 RepID=A0A1M4TP11_9CLOT|nr:GntR family transcriptional regulator [Lactonifactor longoviformis]POP34577.1 LacI family transcriptional regulator [Lactonifactor longoviformis]SHE46232.1 GntR family transcriptional regulator, arabinose operon transcriptional repressor [Lactonifactor longoviformis DSM 17459]
MAGESGKTKYYLLMEQLKDDILSGRVKPGEKLPSENELSSTYQISRHTVRKALAILENEGFVVAEHGRGTFCSERMRHRKNSRNIAVITTYISDYIFPRLIQGIDRVLTSNGYSIILKNTGNSRTNEARALEDILTKDIDGLIIEPSKSQILCNNMNLYAMLDEYEIPYIFIQGTYAQMKHKPHILMDDSQGGYLLTKHLLDTGREKIAGVFKADDSQGRERHKGYVRALQEAGKLYDPDMVVWFHTEDRKKKPALAIRQMMEYGMDMDSVVCYNDQIALEVMKTLQKCGRRIPEDIAVAGYDNSLIAENGIVPLTTIAHPQEKLGEMAAELLLEQIQKIPEEKSKVERLIQPELIVRASTKPQI